MLDIADNLALAMLPLQELLQARLSIAQGQTPQIHIFGKQQVEGEEDQIVGLAVGDRSLQRRKFGHTLMIERDDLAVDQRIRQRARLFRNRPELSRPIEALAGLERNPAVLDTQL